MADPVQLNGVVVPLSVGRGVAVEPQSVRHALNGNCWVEAYPCPAGICRSVCERCHEHERLRAACPSCVPCPYCGRSEA